MKKSVLMIAAIVSGTLIISGCTTNPYTGEREAGKSGIGAGVGSLVGAGIGALSSSKHDRGKGALIGAAAGAALGGGIGYYMDVQEAKLREKMQGTGVSVTRNGDNIVLNMPSNVTFDSSSANQYAISPRFGVIDSRASAWRNFAGSQAIFSVEP